MFLTVDNIVCPCSGGWNSILPPPRCYIHNPPWSVYPVWPEKTWTTTTITFPAEEYVGKHRAPEK